MVNSISSTNLLKQIQQKQNVQNTQAQTETNKTITEQKAEMKTMMNTMLGTDLVTRKNNIQKLDAIFKKLDGKEGLDFVNTAYAELTKFMELDGIAPKEITWEKNEGRAYIVGDYRFYNNSIVFYTDNFMKMDKAAQLGLLAHELTHCKQLANMLRTEGLDVAKIASAYASSGLKAALSGGNPMVMQLYAKAKQEGKEKEFIQQAILQNTIKTTKELMEAHAETLKLPKHPLNSENGKKAQADWVAQMNYNGRDMNSYNNCPMEKEAMAMEYMIIGGYKTFKQM